MSCPDGRLILSFKVIEYERSISLHHRLGPPFHPRAKDDIELRSPKTPSSFFSSLSKDSDLGGSKRLSASP